MTLRKDKIYEYEHESGQTYRLDDSRIQVFNLYKVYKREKVEVVALRGLNLYVKPGELLMIIGPSGCGKTTLLNLISGLDKPTAGKIFIDRKDITELDFDSLTRFRRTKIGFIFQFMNLVKSLNAYENIELPLISLGIPPKERKQRVENLLKLVGLYERRLHFPSELSGGEQQRIAVAIALANNPSIILGDEPTGELDTANAHEVMQVLRNLLNTYPDMSIVIVTHDLSLQKYADRILRMKDGLIDESINLQFRQDQSIKGVEETGGAGSHAGIESPKSGFNIDMLKEALPEYKLLSEIKSCPSCKSSNITITLLRDVNVEKKHELFQIKDVLVMCNDCRKVENIQAKLLHF
ncbi:MAG: ABC transporter ATP-binding protein [Promethearchaeota archaeon]